MYSSRGIKLIRWGWRGSFLAGLLAVVALPLAHWLFVSEFDSIELRAPGERLLPDSILVIGLLVGLAGIQVRQTPDLRHGWLGTAGFLAAFVGVFLGLVTEFLRALSMTVYRLLLLDDLGFFLSLIGFIVLGVAVLRTRTLPRWLGLLLFVSAPAPPIVTFLSLTIEAHVIASLVVAFSLLAMGYALWSTAPPRSRVGTGVAGVFSTRLWNWTGFGKKTLFDWMQLLATASIPVVIAVATLLFTSAQNERNKNIEERRAQDEALRNYLSEMTDLLTSEEADAQRIAGRAGTLTVLKRFDTESESATEVTEGPELIIKKLSPDPRPPQRVLGVTRNAVRTGSAERKARVLQFLYEADLITTEQAVIALDAADFKAVNLRDVNLRYADLSGADLSNADLDSADLSNADLSGADLRRADLHEADLTNANLTEAELTDARLITTDLSNAQGLTQAMLRGTIGGPGSAVLPNDIEPPEEWNRDIFEQWRRRDLVSEF